MENYNQWCYNSIKHKKYDKKLTAANNLLPCEIAKTLVTTSMKKI